MNELKTELRAVVIGASAGGIAALSEVLPALPAGFGVPLLVVVHRSADPASNLAHVLQHKSLLTVKEAEDKEPVAAGTLYLAPGDYHLLVERSGVLSLSVEEPVNFSRPSIDVLFESAADVYGPALLAVILTGANQDGARGMRAVCAAGGTAWVQRPETAEARTMPEAALAACPEAQVLTLEQIAARLQELGKKSSKA